MNAAPPPEKSVIVPTTFAGRSMNILLDAEWLVNVTAVPAAMDTNPAVVALVPTVIEVSPTATIAALVIVPPAEVMLTELAVETLVRSVM